MGRSWSKFSITWDGDRNEAWVANVGALASRATGGDVPFNERLRAPSKAYGDGPDDEPDALMDGCDGGPG